MQQKEKESHFLEQLLDPHKIDDYQLPIPINAELRKYQQVCGIFSKLYSKCNDIYWLCNNFLKCFKYSFELTFSKYICHISISASVLLVEWQERHLACKKFCHESTTFPKRSLLGTSLAWSNSRKIGQLNNNCCQVFSVIGSFNDSVAEWCAE